MLQISYSWFDSLCTFHMNIIYNLFTWFTRRTIGSTVEETPHDDKIHLLKISEVALKLIEEHLNTEMHLINEFTHTKILKNFCDGLH